MKYFKWWLVFGLILTAALLYHLLKVPSANGFLGFPNWIWVFGGIHLVFAFAMYLFGKTLVQKKS